MLQSPCRHSNEPNTGLSASTDHDEVEPLKPLGVGEAVDRGDPDAGRYAEGALLPGGNARLTGPTFEQWLDETMPVAT
jgi:hypothetical protein